MVNSQDERWLKRILEGCFTVKTEDTVDEKSLIGFRILVTNLVKNIEKNLKLARGLWERKPDSEELRKKLDYLAKQLFYLRRFCQGKIKKKN